MKKHQTVAIVLAAGLGTRMGSKLPKVLHPLGGRPMLLQLFETLLNVQPDTTVLVTGPDMDTVSAAVKHHKLNTNIIIQEERLGTGHAVMVARDFFEGETGTVLVVYGDTPLLTVATINSMIQVRKSKENHAVVVLGFKPSEVGEYGRLILDNTGSLQKIVEAKDASSEELKQPLCNSGIMAIDSIYLPFVLDQLKNDNAKGEYYLTDIVEIAISQGRTCAVVEGDENEVLGVNSKVELAAAETILQKRYRQRAMNAGVTLMDPSSVYFSWDTKLGDNVSVGPNVYFGQGVTVEDDVEIKSFTHLEGTKVSSGAVIGPFARLRPGTDIGRAVHIGNFVEIKNSVISSGVKANHLSYIGDAKVGQNANIGAGTITCNYDGQKKSTTEIGPSAFIGSNTSLVAPIKVGFGAVTGAGSVITEDVEDHTLAVTRGTQKMVPGWSKRRRKLKGDE